MFGDHKSGVKPTVGMQNLCRYAIFYMAVNGPPKYCLDCGEVRDRHHRAVAL